MVDGGVAEVEGGRWTGGPVDGQVQVEAVES
jgi:hypothetical protein